MLLLNHKIWEDFLMPDFLTHQYFGDLVFDQLPDSIKDMISRNKDLYDIGLQGPDPLFFYKPYKSNPISKQGTVLHELNGADYFGNSLTVLKNNKENADAALAYQSGFLCHYALDSVCHSFVNRYIKQTGVTHTDIEGEFERYLMEKAGKDPLRVNPADYINIKKEYGEIISRFTMGLEPKDCYDAVRSFKRYRNFFFCPGSLKRTFVYGFLKALGQYDNNRGQVMNVEPYPNTQESDEELYKLLHDTVPLALRLIPRFVTAYEQDEPSIFLMDNSLQIPFNGIEV